MTITKTKKLTKTTLKMFIKKNMNNNLHKLTISRFDGMEDGVRDVSDPHYYLITREPVIKHEYNPETHIIEQVVKIPSIDEWVGEICDWDKTTSISWIDEDGWQGYRVHSNWSGIYLLVIPSSANSREINGGT